MKSKSTVPESMKVHLSKFFGENSKEASRDSMTDSEWKHTLRKVLSELYHYIEENVNSDNLHTLMLYSGLSAAMNPLKKI